MSKHDSTLNSFHTFEMRWTDGAITILFKNNILHLMVLPCLVWERISKKFVKIHLWCILISTDNHHEITAGKMHQNPYRQESYQAPSQRRVSSWLGGFKVQLIVEFYIYLPDIYISTDRSIVSLLTKAVPVCASHLDQQQEAHCSCASVLWFEKSVLAPGADFFFFCGLKMGFKCFSDVLTTMGHRWQKEAADVWST